MGCGLVSLGSCIGRCRFPPLTGGRTFLVLPRKVAKRRRARCGARLRRVLCAAREQRGAAELGPAGLRQSSPSFPLSAALLDTAEGRGKASRFYGRRGKWEVFQVDRG